MPPLAGQLAQAALVVLALLALVLAFRPRPRASDREVTLARAQWLTVAAVAVGLSLVVETVLRREVGNPFAVVSFLGLVAYGAGAALVVGRVWRRHRRLAADEEHARWVAVTAAQAPSRHRGLSGEERPPRRW